jgi:hypothetical protein
MNERRTKSLHLIAGLALGVVALAVQAKPQQPTADAVLAWNTLATEAMVAFARIQPPGVPPNREARIYAMAFVAMHDTLNAIQRRYEPYACHGFAPGASPTAAVATAAHDVLVAAFPPGAATFASDYQATLADENDSERTRAGIELGRHCARVILALRAIDGSDAAQVPYVPGSDPGDYRFTFPFDIPGLPVYGFVADPLWGQVDPFVLQSAAQFRSPPPYGAPTNAEAVRTAMYTIDFDEIRQKGALAGSTRTADESEIAKFWVENSPLGWNRIARTVAGARGLGGWELARLFALLQLAEADAYLASFETKYFYRFWRPYTAIRLADGDGNPDTIADANWLPFDPVTPPVPDYNSAHSAAGGAARAVLARFFGTDGLHFAQTSTSLPGVTRHYASFTAAADENGRSRILVGFHFRHAVDEGRLQGERVGHWVFERALQPVR